MRRLIPLIRCPRALAPSCPRDYGPPTTTRRRHSPLRRARGATISCTSRPFRRRARAITSLRCARGNVDADRWPGPPRVGVRVANARVLPDVPRVGQAEQHDPSDRSAHGLAHRVVTDSRPGLPLLQEAGRFERGDPGFTALALTADRAGLFVARVLSAGPRVWIGRYDARSGTLQAERSWPITAIAANVQIGVAGDRLIAVISRRPTAASSKRCAFSTRRSETWPRSPRPTYPRMSAARSNTGARGQALGDHLRAAGRPPRIPSRSRQRVLPDRVASAGGARSARACRRVGGEGRRGRDIDRSRAPCPIRWRMPIRHRPGWPNPTDGRPSRPRARSHRESLLLRP